MKPFVTNGFSARRVMSAVCAVGVIIALSACGVDAGKAQAEPAASASTAPTTSVSPSATPSATAKNGVEAGDVINGIPTKKELANDGKGDYIQTTISPDDPAFIYNPAIVEPNASSTYTEAEIREVQKKFVTFVAEEAIDSTLNDNPADSEAQDAWWAKHKDQIAPYSQDRFLAALKANDPNQPFVFRGQHRQTSQTKYSLAHGSGVTHVNSRKITLKAARAGVLEGRQVLGFQADVEFTLNAVVNGKPALETVTGTLSYTYTKESSGQFLLSGNSGRYNITPPVS